MIGHPFRNLGLKALALGLAALLWANVARDSSVERSVRVPVEFQNIPEGLEIVSDPPGSVDVRVRGTSSRLGRLEPGEIVAVLDLNTARPGQRLFHLITDEVRVPFGVQVAQVTPGTVALDFERSATKRVPVVPAVEGTPAPGHAVGTITSDPAEVDVVGPETRLRRLTQATTEPVSVRGATRRVTDRVTVGVPDSKLRLATARTAIVTVEITQAPIERAVAGVRVGQRNRRGVRRALIRPETVTVVIRGPRDTVAALAAGELDAFVDLAGLGPGRYVLPVRADPSGDYTVVRVEPPTVQVGIR